MLWLVFSIFLVAGLFIGLGFGDDEDDNSPFSSEIKWKLRKRQFLSLLGGVVLIFGMFTRIPANSVGILYSPFGGTRTETMSEGFHTKSIFDKVYKITTEVQSLKIENLTTQTKDAQFLTSSLDVKFKVSADNAFVIFKQYKTLDNMSSNLITPTTQRVLELITTHYNIIDILGEKRSAIYSELEQSLLDEFAKYGVEFVAISITDMDAGEALEKAITDEAVAKKEVETAEQNLLKTQTEAKQKSVQAQAEQDAAKIESETKIIEAEAEKKANELLNQSLSDDILKKEWIDKWDGHMPTYYGGDGNLMLNVEDAAE